MKLFRRRRLKNRARDLIYIENTLEENHYTNIADGNFVVLCLIIN